MKSPKKAHQNRFLGQQTDFNERDQRNDKFLELKNGRLYQKDGGFLVLDTITGNHLRFSLPDGFSILGYTVYNGIAFITGLDEVNTTVCIGTYPSPNYEDGIGYVEEFRLLKNYTGNVNYNLPQFVGKDAEKPPVQDFEVFNIYFGWDCKRRLDILPRKSYDGSINLYIADGITPNFVINTGFRHETGEILDRYVSLQDLQNKKLIQYNESAFLPSFLLSKIESDGAYLAGQYFFFLRYVSIDGSSTSFVAASNAVTVAGSTNSEPNGPVDVYGGADTDYSNKSITFNLLGLDNSYRFFQIGFVHYTGGFNQAYLINQEYTVHGTTQIKLTGREATTLLDPGLLLSDKPVEKACKSQTQLNKVYYGANWRARNLHHNDFCQFAAKVRIVEVRTKVRDKRPYLPHDNAILIGNANAYNNAANEEIGEWNIYNNAEDGYNNGGYFNGEAYAFAIHPVFDDGTRGLGYPMQGFDNYYNDYRDPNDKGIFRFSSLHIVPNVGTDGGLYIKQPVFDFSDTELTSFISQNVKGWYISRAKLNKNAYYQGLGMNVYDGEVNTDPSNWLIQGGFSPTVEEFNTDKFVPLYHGYEFAFVRREANNNLILLGGHDGGNLTFGSPVSNHTEDSKQTDKYAMFSVDYMLGHAQGKLIPSGGFIQILGAVSTYARIRNNGTSDNSSYHDIIGWDILDYSHSVIRDGDVYPAKFHNINGFDYNGDSGFVSRFDNGREPIANGFYRVRDPSAGNDNFYMNMPFATPAYVGITGYEGPDLFNKLINICKSDPTALDITTLYDVAHENYSVISALIPVANKAFVFVGGGDNFLQKGFMKTMVGTNNFDSAMIENLAEDMSFGEIENGYGLMLGFLTENNYNLAMRVEKSPNKFFPATGWNDMGAFVFPYNIPESNFSNAGYQEVLSPRTLPAWNPYGIYGAEHYPTRIRYTNPHDVIGTADAYRTSGAIQVEDFDLQFGQIMSILAEYGRLYSFQEKCINLHPVSERATTDTTDGDKVILGESLGLTAYVNRISDKVGLQHQWAIQKGLRGIYGMDYDMRINWRVMGEQVELLSEVKGVSAAVEKFIQETRNKKTHYPARLADNHLCGEGIHAGYNMAHKEIIFTLLDGNQSDTIVFSEKYDEYGGSRSFHPTLYLMLNEDLYHHRAQTGEFWEADSELARRGTFFGILHPLTIKFVVDVEGSETTQFHNMVVNAAGFEFLISQFKTEYQEAILLWPNAPFYHQPKFKKDRWHISIPRAQVAFEANVRQGSVLRGRYLEVTLVYNQDKALNLRDVLTYYLHAPA